MPSGALFAAGYLELDKLTSSYDSYFKHAFRHASSSSSSHRAPEEDSSLLSDDYANFLPSSSKPAIAPTRLRPAIAAPSPTKPQPLPAAANTCPSDVDPLPALEQFVASTRDPNDSAPIPSLLFVDPASLQEVQRFFRKPSPAAYSTPSGTASLNDIYKTAHVLPSSGASLAPLLCSSLASPS